MMILSFGLFFGYFYDLDYRLINDIGVSIIIVIFLGINSVIKLVRCHRTGLFQCNHIFLYGKALMRSIVVLSPVPPTREGYGHALP